MFLDVTTTLIVLAAIFVLMPARAFFVFGQKKALFHGMATFSSNAREGIFCFWTNCLSRIPRLCLRSNAREGIFCFWTV